MTTGAEPGPGFAWPDLLCDPVRSLPDHARLWVALSGGLDSVLLLHLVTACHKNRVPVGAIHVNHQLQPNAGTTEGFCRQQCQALGIPLRVETVTVDRGRSGAGVGGIEEAARKARYQAFEALVQADDLLLMAHHADDQAETVLFRLIRGSGVAGLAGMPRFRSLGRGHLVRPLLALERSELEYWARKASLTWVDDPSNDDQGYDRNYLRHAILPGLRARWPGLIQRLRHSAGACGESQQLNDRLAALQWQSVADGQGRVSVTGLRALSLPEQKNLVRWWARERGYPAPVVADWQQVMTDLLAAGVDREPELRADGFSLRRFQGHVYLVPTPSALPDEPVELLPGSPVSWGPWQLQLEPVANPESARPPIRVSTRRGGERLRTHPDRSSKTLKNWLQERSIPPWERARLPLVFAGSEADGELIAVADLWCSDRYSGSAPAAGWRLIVTRECD